MRSILARFVSGKLLDNEGNLTVLVFKSGFRTNITGAWVIWEPRFTGSREIYEFGKT